MGKIKHPEFPMASGELTRPQFRELMGRALTVQASFSAPGAICAHWIDWRSCADMVHVGEDIFDALLNIAVWVKPSGGLGAYLRSQHEFCCLFRVKGGKHDNFVQLGRYGRTGPTSGNFPLRQDSGPSARIWRCTRHAKISI